MSCFPYFENTTVHYYYFLRTHTQDISCSVLGCKYIGIDKCKKGLCRWKFCQFHRDHKHCVCSTIVDGKTCDNYGVHSIANISDCAICDDHKNMYEQILLCDKQRMCKICNKQNETIFGHCDSCFVIQLLLHLNALTSLFSHDKEK
jgi:hypothetical protein